MGLVISSTSSKHLAPQQFGRGKQVAPQCSAGARATEWDFLRVDMQEKELASLAVSAEVLGRAHLGQQQAEVCTAIEEAESRTRIIPASKG